jgi:hypothetical protein
MAADGEDGGRWRIADRSREWRNPAGQRWGLGRRESLNARAFKNLGAIFQDKPFHGELTGLWHRARGVMRDCIELVEDDPLRLPLKKSDMWSKSCDSVVTMVNCLESA